MDVQLDPSGNVVFAVNGAPASTTNTEYDSQIFVLPSTAALLRQEDGQGQALRDRRSAERRLAPTPCDDGAIGNARADASPDSATKATQANLGYMIGMLRFDAEGNIILADGGSKRRPVRRRF